MINVRITELLNKDDLKLATRPYTIKGRMQVRYYNGRWSYKIIEYKNKSLDDAPIDEYDYDKYSKNYVIFGAYVNDKCVGFALLEKTSRTRYLYVREVRTDSEYLSQGIGTKLLQHCFDKALALGYRGIYAVTPDNNLDSCRFYLYNGFRIGGLDTEYYMGTNNEGKKDIIFYRG
ncbi:MAG: GNAT family N-acetyltransferase [Eubacteriales bacterium]|nr:GNAT family N-acetyltransferase [Eubacteriales bacterium]